jgi:hypothetical protein
VVISSAFQGDSAVHRIQPGRWTDHVDEVLDALAANLKTGSPDYA